MSSGSRRPLAVVALVIVVGVACQREPPVEPLREVRLPDLARLDASVQTQVRGKYAALERIRASAGASPAQLGTAFGEYGMLLHAAEYLSDADAAYRNAHTLMPNDVRWPYYLALVRRAAGDNAEAITLLTRVVELRPNDLPALIWLGRAHLDQGMPAEAEALFTRAQAVAPGTVAVNAGLAQVALERKDYARVIALIEEALAIKPDADSLRSQLATAYRALGQTAKAEEQSRRWRNTDVTFPDPMREELDLALESGLSYELRGVRVMTDGDYPGAVEFFRRGVALSPGETQLGRSLRHKLGTALYLQGRVDEAVRQFEEVTRLAPKGEQDEPTAKAFYSLGVLMSSSGDTARAIAHLQQAVTFSPSYVEARLVLGDVLRRTGRIDAALAQYRAAVAANPRAAEARFGYAMGLVRQRKWAEARGWLEESVRVLPDRADLRHALARLLAAAPEAAIRDGQRALTMAEALAQSWPTPDVGETMAMAQAELGRFAQAAEIQRRVIDAARAEGDQAAVRRMSANLRLYEARQPCRTPWPDDHPVHAPAPGA